MYIDEEQDMSAYQAHLFWGKNERTDRRIYLFDEQYQQVYPFRGVSRSFWDMVEASSPKFTLTGYFWCGKNIVPIASCVLNALGGETLHGRLHDEGRVLVVDKEEEGPTMRRCVIFCRTQNGMYPYHHTNRPAHWCYLSGESKTSPCPEQWQLNLESFMKIQKEEGSDEDSLDSAPAFTYNGEMCNNIQCMGP